MIDSNMTSIRLSFSNPPRGYGRIIVNVGRQIVDFFFFLFSVYENEKKKFMKINQD